LAKRLWAWVSRRRGGRSFYAGDDAQAHLEEEKGSLLDSGIEDPPSGDMMRRAGRF
jgi:hypothetical protein